MKIVEYFEYWDEFFTIWKQSQNQTDYNIGFLKLKSEFQKFKFPYPQNILNSDLNTIETFDYIPEPYWGWTPNLNTDLEFVVVNYNPASASVNQHRNCININNIRKYSDYVQQEIIGYLNFKNHSFSQKPNQYETSNWHFNNRVKKISQINTSELSIDYSLIKNYIGIDLVPWHSQNVNSLNGYLQLNFEPIQKWSLNFAIEASKIISSKSKLKNKVIVRTNFETFYKLFRNEFNTDFFIIGERINSQKINNDNYQQIKIDGSDVTLLLLWGMRNSLPSKEFMEYILNKR